MTGFRALRRLAVLLALAVTATGLMAVGAAGPASARDCSAILTAAPGGSPGSIFVTFDPSVGPYTVGVLDRDLPRERSVEFLASTPGVPDGTELGGLAPSTQYWVYVVSGGCLSDGVLVTSSPGVSDLWVQAYGRHLQSDLCLSGWWASYAEWPNAGRGGWTCERYLSRHGSVR